MNGLVRRKIRVHRHFKKGGVPLSRKLKSRDEGKHKSVPRRSQDRKTMQAPPHNTTGVTYV